MENPRSGVRKNPVFLAFSVPDTCKAAKGIGITVLLRSHRPCPSYTKLAEQAENVELSRFQLFFCTVFLIKWKITESNFPSAAT